VENVSSNNVSLEPILRLSKDLKKSAKLLSHQQARYLVDSYYQLQELRKASSNQVFSMTKSDKDKAEVTPIATETVEAQPDEPCDVLVWFRDNAEALEKQIQRALGAYASAHRVGRWSQSQTGIGPVISAGLLAHVDMKPWRCMKHRMLVYKNEPACTEKEPHEGFGCSRQPLNTVGQLWRFAGLDPTLVWEKGQKRPFNADLKVLCWKIGQSFLKLSNHPDCLYGALLRERWESEKAKNEKLMFADQAKAKLEKFNIGKSTDAYKAYSIGKLPPAHILQRACRYATKLFLAHWHDVAWECQYGTQPVKPYVLEHLGHVDYIKPPNWPCE
jgi:hypothetical protein